MKPLTWLVAVLAFMALTACTGVRIRGASGRPGKLYESFYRADGATQYYIKPLLYASAEQEALVDFVYRSNFSADSLVTCNFSVRTPTLLSDVDQMFFRGDELLSAAAVKKLYEKREKKQFHTRYSAALPYASFKKIVAASGFNLVLERSGTMNVLTPGQKTSKRLAAIQEQLFFR